MRLTENTETQNYIESLIADETEAMLLARKYAVELGLDRISLSKSEGQILKTLVQIVQPQKVIEIGTLTALSALYIESALPLGAKLWTLEKNEEHIFRAEKVLQAQGLSTLRVEIVRGDARLTLQELVTQGPFDMIFIDGNKAAYMDYLLWAIANLRSGGVVVADNVFLSGAVWGKSTEQKFSSKQIEVMRSFNQTLADPTKFTAALLPTYEGLFVGIKK